MAQLRRYRLKVYPSSHPQPGLPLDLGHLGLIHAGVRALVVHWLNRPAVVGLGDFRIALIATSVEKSWFKIGTVGAYLVVFGILRKTLIKN